LTVQHGMTYSFEEIEQVFSGLLPDLLSVKARMRSHVHELSM